MRGLTEPRRWLLCGLFAGVLLGSGAYDLGVRHACPGRSGAENARITPVTDRAYFDVAHRMLTEAKTSVHIVAFELKYYATQPGSRENRLMRDLIYAKERGLDVRVIVDEFSREDNAFDTLRAAGIDVRMDGNQTTTHAKLIVVDGRTVLLGSTNFSYYALERNNEANVLIEDENAGRYFEDYFDGLWTRTRI